jgi:hypothetical protein
MMKTLELMAVVRRGETASQEDAALMGEMVSPTPNRWFYAPKAYDHPLPPGGISPDEIAGVVWRGISAVVGPEGTLHFPLYGDTLSWLGTVGADGSPAPDPRGYVYAVDEEGTEYLWAYNPLVDSIERERLSDFYELHVELIAREIRRIREGGR